MIVTAIIAILVIAYADRVSRVRHPERHTFKRVDHEYDTLDHYSHKKQDALNAANTHRVRPSRYAR